MKNKPQRHKESNVFKFKSFSDRISQIDIRHTALYHIHHVNEGAPEENETHFHQTYQKWIVLNLTDEYNRFQKQIRSIITLPQLLHKKDFVVNLLLETLDSASTLSLQPLLEFVVILAKDLRQEFYPYFTLFLEKCIKLLNTKDSDQLEWTLICLAYLFKTLKSFLKKDLLIVFNLILPLLNDRNPEHVTNFAAECFSFIARDVKEKEKLLPLIMSGLKKHKNGVNGCGRLLYEIVKGVEGHLHSCVEVFLKEWLKMLKTSSANFDHEMLFEVLTIFLSNVLQNVYPVNLKIFWEISHEVLVKDFYENVAENDVAIRQLFNLMGQCVEYRNGKSLTTTTDLMIASLLKAIDLNVSQETQLIVSQIMAVLLLSPNLTITQLDASRMSKKILGVEYRDVFEEFVWNCCKYSQFEHLIFPEFIRYFEKYFGIDDEEIATPLELLTKIILTKSPLRKTGTDLESWKTYPIILRNEQTIDKIEQLILNIDFHKPEQFLMASIIYPHCCSTKNDGEKSPHVLAKLNDLIVEICDHLGQSDQFHDHKKYFFILSIVVETLIHLNQFELIDVAALIKSLLPFAQDIRYLPALWILDQICVLSSQQKPLSYETFKNVHECIAENLSSPYRECRLITAHILMTFAKLPELKAIHDETGVSIFEIFYNVERIEATVTTYREQLMLLQKLSPDQKLFTAVKETVCCEDPLRYFLGVLYINFNLLWKPVNKLIIAYSTEMDLTAFWQIFKSKMEQTTVTIREQSNQLSDDDDSAPSNGFDTQNNQLLDLFCAFWDRADRPDFINYRITMWRMIGDSCGQLVEIKNRDVVTMFMDFLDVEYARSHENYSSFWNVLKNDESVVDEDGDEDEDVVMNESSKKESERKRKKSPSHVLRTLTTMISVFSNLANPKQIYRQTEMYALYLELLCHGSDFIQKLALDCIIAYKHKFVTPYKDQLYGIIDEKRFKDTITAFKIQKDESQVLGEHRADLMPILMRILYSKLVGRTQKGGAQNRKALVMRFLGNCEESEILILLKMAFRVYEIDNFDTLDSKQLVEKISSTLNLKSIISPKKLTSSLNFIEIIREQFGGLMGADFLRYLLKVLFAIGVTVEGVLEKSKTTPINGIFEKMFKTLRSSCLVKLGNFFNHFDTYPWDVTELEMIFDIFINPLMTTISNDSKLSATPLLKLFGVFSKNPRYFILFTKIGTDDKIPLDHIMELLLDTRTRPLVCLAIMEMLQNLLSFGDEEMNDNALKPLGSRPPIEHSLKINFGSAILLPYVGKVIEKFQMNLKKRRGLTKRDLLILSRCTELIVDSDTCSSLLTVLLPILIRKSHSNAAGEDALAQMVTTITNLFEKIENPKEHIRSIAPLFEQITAIGPRKLLCDLVRTISKRSVSSDEGERLQTLSEIIYELNALDRRWIEQPDYERRLNAYKRISELQQTDRLDLDLGLMIIYHSFYFIKHDKDMAMRDSACYHLRSIVPALTNQLLTGAKKDAKDLDYLIGTVVLNLIRRSLNDKNENVRNEAILLLGELARECPTAHAVLQDLHYISSKQDREIDFFDNMTHLQSHRHGRALLRFCTVAKTFTHQPNTRTLTQFILPLASQYLCAEKYATKNGLVTAAIETVAVVCRLLPWHQYELILKYYLKKMRYNVEHQRQLVRLVMQILDSFHFDLSKAKVVPKEIGDKIKQMTELAEKEAESEPLTQEIEKLSQIDVVADEDDGEEIVLKTAGEEDLNENELNDELDKVKADDDEDEEEGDETASPVKKIKISIYDKATVLSHKAAKRLVHTIATGLIPTLNNAITTISTYESFHKLNKKKRRSEREEEEILRVPIALAMVKLLQKLPEGMLDHSMPGIFTKVCMFLRSPLRSVRMVTRDILKNIMLTVGTKYLETLLNQMTSLLTRGFQVHVLTVTVYSVLDALKTTFKAGDIDKVLQGVLAVSLEDIFGKTGEEKEIAKIAGQTPEAKPSNKSYLTLHILAINITQSCMLDLLVPFKDLLAKSQSKKVVTKVQECFQKIVMGMVLNKHISLESLVMFVYGISSESIPDLLPGRQQIVLTEKEKEQIKRARPDCFLIKEEPRGRTGAIRKVVVNNVKANAHVMVEFGLDMLQIILKRGKLLKIDFEPFLNPIVPILLDSLKSTHIMVTIYALKCLIGIWNREMKLENMKLLIGEIVQELFSILHKYATAGLSATNDNYRLVRNSFNAMVSLIRCCDYFEITEDQLKTILLYVEQNLFDVSKQTIAFSMLKVIVGRRLLVAEIHDVMRKISEIAIVSDSSVARQDAKNLMINYLMDYPLGKKVDGYLKFFISNLNYELIAGREAAAQILHAIINRFPKEILHKKSSVIFLSLAARLINDDSVDCRVFVAQCLESLLQKIDPNNRNELFEVCLEFIADSKPSHKEMAALLITRFVNAEKQKFTERIGRIVPELISTLSSNSFKGPGRFVRMKQTVINSEDEELDDDLDTETAELLKQQEQRSIDHQKIQILNTILRIIEQHPDEVFALTAEIDELAYEAQRLLAYEHVWVRINAAKILDHILSRLDVQLLQKIIENQADGVEPPMQFLYANPRGELKSLCLDLCAQLNPDETDDEMANQVIKNLLYLANVIKLVKFDKLQRDEDGEGGKCINLMWLIRRMRYVVHAEVAKAPHSIILRTAVFQWIEGLAELLPLETTTALAPTLLAPIVREMSDDDKNIDPKLKQLAIKVGNSIRSKIGEDDYNLLRTQLQTKLMIKRAERKKELAHAKINDPVRAAMRKQGEKDRKKVAKKRKMDVMKGRAVPKKKKKLRNVEEDDMF